MTTETDALTELCAAERGSEVPPDGAVDAGWERLVATLGPGPGGGDGGPGDAGTVAAASGGASATLKVAAALALATALGVGVAVSSSGGAPEARAPAVDVHEEDGAPPSPRAVATAEREDPALPADSATPTIVPDPAATEVVPDDDDHDATPTPTPTPSAASATAPPRPSTALPDVPGEGLAHEVAILREASAALAAGKPALALRWTRRHAADHPEGSLTEERLATEAIARCSLHDRRGANAAARFLDRYPRSTHESRVRAACATMLER